MKTILSTLKRGSATLKQVILNVFWLGLDRIIRIVVGFFVYAWVARYLGAENLGLWNYCIAFAGLFVVFSNLGLDDVVVRELVRNPEQKKTILATAFYLKLVAGFATCLIVVAVFLLLKGNGGIGVWLVGLYSLGFIFQSTNVIDLYFKAELLSKYTFYASGISFLVCSCLKLVLIFLEAELIVFAMVGLLEFMITAILLVVAYNLNKQDLKNSTFDWNKAKQLLNHSLPLIFFGFAIMMLLRMDQLMIGEFLGNAQVGLYSVAIRITEMINTVPAMLIVSLFPAVVRSKELDTQIYEKRIEILHSFIFIFTLLLVLPIWLFNTQIINLVFGNEFSQSGMVLAILVWSSVFSALGMASKNVFMAENMQKYIFLRTVLALVINFFLNLILIPRYGIVGAAVSTLIAQAVLAYFSDFLFPGSRKFFFIKSKAIFCPDVRSIILKRRPTI